MGSMDGLNEFLPDTNSGFGMYIDWAGEELEALGFEKRSSFPGSNVDTPEDVVLYEGIGDDSLFVVLEEKYPFRAVDARCVESVEPVLPSHHNLMEDELESRNKYVMADDVELEGEVFVERTLWDAADIYNFAAYAGMKDFVYGENSE